ncbi:ABC transporter substrate-binding protein [Aurantiacibacter flavus]|uniref:ABC transporter substrate-binding protein n=1 Tax=Aurantiacibacter flavus TaxID=3145232 RepID=A0ABV0CYR5_9SPHN
MSTISHIHRDWRGAMQALAVAVALLVLAACSEAEVSVATESSTIVDVAGREVAIEGQKTRLAIDDSRYLIALSLLHEDPASLLAGWAHDSNRLGEETYAAMLERAPGLADLPRIASSAQEFNVESLIAARPDVAILSTESGVTEDQIARVEAAGIPVVMLDFFTSPMQNLERSVTVLGKITGREEQAERFLAFRRERIAAIEAALADLPDSERKLVFMEAHAGGSPDCCNSPGSGNASEYLELVGGHNIGADTIAQASGKLSLEYVLSRNPAVYIGTGGPHLAAKGGLVLGAGFSPETARQSLQRVTARPGIADLAAVRAGKAYGYSHQLLNSPLDIVAIETFAKWLHPERFAALDPAQTLTRIGEDFGAVTPAGSYWIALKP